MRDGCAAGRDAGGWTAARIVGAAAWSAGGAAGCRGRPVRACPGTGCRGEDARRGAVWVAQGLVEVQRVRRGADAGRDAGGGRRRGFFGGRAHIIEFTPVFAPHRAFCFLRVVGRGLRGMYATALRIAVIGLWVKGWTDGYSAGKIAGRSMRDAFRVMPRWLAADSGGFLG